MPSPYHSLSCRLHAELETRLVRHDICRLVYCDDSGHVTVERTRIADVYTRRGEEFVRLPRGPEIALSHILRIGDQRFSPPRG